MIYYTNMIKQYIAYRTI